MYFSQSHTMVGGATDSRTQFEVPYGTGLFSSYSDNSQLTGIVNHLKNIFYIL